MLRALISTTDVSMAGLGFGQVPVGRDADGDPYWHSYDSPITMAAPPRATESSGKAIHFEIGHGEEPSWPDDTYFKGNDVY